MNGFFGFSPNFVSCAASSIGAAYILGGPQAVAYVLIVIAAFSLWNMF